MSKNSHRYKVDTAVVYPTQCDGDDLGFSSKAEQWVFTVTIISNMVIITGLLFVLY